MKVLKASEPLLLDGVVTPDAILKDPTLSAGARLLWVMLAEYQGKVPEYYPSQEMLALPLGVKVRQLQSFIKELESYTRVDPPEPFPLIEVKLVFVEKDRKTRNIYNLLRWPFLAFDLKANGAERSHLADGGDAQYSAHRSEGEAQDAAAAPAPGDMQSYAHRSGSDTRDSWTAPPATPGKEGGVTPDGMRDTQSSAHQSEGATPDTVASRRAMATEKDEAQNSAHRSGSDAQDTAPAPPRISSDNVGAVPTGKPPSDAQSSAHWSEYGALDTAGRRPQSHWSEYCALDTGGWRPPVRTGDSGAGSHGRPPGDGGARVMSTSGQPPRLQQAQPLALDVGPNVRTAMQRLAIGKHNLEEPVNHIPPDIRKRPAVASGPLAAPRSKRPGYVEFPKCKYHADHEAVVVDNAEDEAKLGEGWQDVPV